MSYTPQQGLFINGRIADGQEVLNEFNAISVAITEVDNKVASEATKALGDSKVYTDGKLTELTVDGGEL